jgi:hypothetical protein
MGNDVIEKYNELKSAQESPKSKESKKKTSIIVKLEKRRNQLHEEL